MATLTKERPPNGSVRARRVAYFIALIRSYPEVTRDELQETLGWSDEEMEQLLADFRVMSRELSILSGS